MLMGAVWHGPPTILTEGCYVQGQLTVTTRGAGGVPVGRIRAGSYEAAGPGGVPSLLEG